mgnify:CR=1 FL=1
MYIRLILVLSLGSILSQTSFNQEVFVANKYKLIQMSPLSNCWAAWYVDYITKMQSLLIEYRNNL